VEVAAAGSTGRRWPPYLSLTTQFSIVAAAVLLVGMVAQASWMAAAIESRAKFHAGAAAAIFVDHVIAPFVSTLRPGAALSPEQLQAIDELMSRASGRMQITAMKLWSPDGTILYSTNPQSVGQSFGHSDAFRLALAGEVSIEFDLLDEEESRYERGMGIPLIEVYVPIRASAGPVVAVAEFYENAEALTAELAQSRRHTWLVTGVVFLGMIASLLMIVVRGSRLIDRQRQALTEKIRELSHLLRRNSELQDRVERAARLAAAESEQLLHRLGADLHDGPAQLISFALMRLDTLESAFSRPVPPTAVAQVASVRGALTDAMSEVRHICAGLSMPRIACLPIADAIRLVVQEHEQRTGTVVACTLDGLPLDTPHFITASLCRFVQEGLNNSYRHAGGKGRSVTACTRDGAVCVEVVDAGPGMERAARFGLQRGLGLAGLVNRIETLGGTLRIRSVLGEGTMLSVTMPIEGREGSTS
jgi:signal transduction histidine kinase